MCHSSFIHSPLEGYLGCFQVLTIMNKAAISIHAQVLFFFFGEHEFSAHLGKYQEA